MYCPQCGQQQTSTEMRFCSRCGFQLAGVTELLATGGNLISNTTPPTGTMSPRRKGIKQGATMMILGAVIVPILGILDSFQHGPSAFDMLAPLAAVICFAGGLMRILYAMLFEQNTPVIKENTPPAFAPAPVMTTGGRLHALPPQQSTPVSDFVSPRRTHTAELVPPPSVTENTTKLLDEEKSLRND